MEITSIIAIAVAIVVIYFFIKLVISPAIKAVGGIILFLAALYILQKYFNLDIDRILSPFGITLNLSKLISGLGWIFDPIVYYINKIISLFF